MIKCPKCNEEARVNGSNKWIEGEGCLRNRKCISCGYKFRTMEVVDSDYNILIGITASIEGIIRKILSDATEPPKV